MIRKAVKKRCLILKKNRFSAKRILSPFNSPTPFHNTYIHL